MAEIVMIPIDHLHAHPDNPRKDLGDLSELAESIKAKGILQNLTVVPLVLVDPDATISLGDDHYCIVIGHRRQAAALLAGLTELPCAIVQMSYEDQIATMLVENMQRSDLTVYEEAKGFQMMLDLGKSIKEVSEMSGFSETTVRHRAKLAELDEKKFKKAVDRGATLFDFMELESFDDPAEKETLLDVIGTSDFKNKLSTLKTQKRNRELLIEWENQISQWAVKCDDIVYGHHQSKAIVNGEEFICAYSRNYGTWNQSKKDAVTPPDDADTATYYYKVCSSQIDVYRAVDEDTETNRQAEEAERQRIRDEYEAKKQRFIDMTARHRQLRQEFIKGFNAYQKKDVIVWEFISEALISANLMPMSCGYQTRERMKALADWLGITYDESSKELKYHEFMMMKSQEPERTAVMIAFFMMDDGSFWDYRWNSDKQHYEIVWKNNVRLDKCIKLLTYLGYHESLEETELRRGSLKDFDVTSEDAYEDEPDEDYGDYEDYEEEEDS